MTDNPERGASSDRRYAVTLETASLVATLAAVALAIAQRRLQDQSQGGTS